MLGVGAPFGHSPSGSEPRCSWTAERCSLTALQPLLDRAKRELAQETSVREKFKRLARLCSEQLGGEAAMRDVSLTEQALVETKQRLGSNVVPVHELLGRAGVCRHRALLFKVLSDDVGLPCRLVRGDYDSWSSTGAHAWNVVSVDRALFLADVMHAPGTLYAIDSVKAKHYRRLSDELVGGRAGAGMNSVPAPAVPPPYVIPRTALRLIKKIGEGGFGIVHLAQWNHEHVALKEMKDGMQGQSERTLFLNELSLLQSLKHNRVVQFYGGDCEDGESCFIVTEFMQRGSLLACLEQARDKFGYDGLGSKLLLDAAKGLRYLHSLSPPQAHFDIKLANILVSEDDVAKIADVGMSKHVMQTATTPQGWTPAYASPEVMMGERANEKADIYSFGVAVLELLAGRLPTRWEGARGLAEDQSPGWPVHVRELLLGGESHGGALARDSTKRPSAEQVVRALCREPKLRNQCELEREAKEEL